MTLRKATIKLAHDNPTLRKVLLPLVSKTAARLNIQPDKKVLDKFIQGDWYCPYCGYHGFTQMASDPDNPGWVVYFECYNCKAEWTETFAHKGFKDFKGPATTTPKEPPLPDSPLAKALEE